jgi:hypothetical protein
MGFEKDLNVSKIIAVDQNEDELIMNHKDDHLLSSALHDCCDDNNISSNISLFAINKNQILTQEKNNNLLEMEEVLDDRWFAFSK